MSSGLKFNTNSLDFSDCDSELSTFIMSDRKTFPSFLIEKDIAMSPIEFLEEDSLLESSCDHEDDSPNYHRINTNVVLISSRSQDGIVIDDALINGSLNVFPTIINENKY